MDKVNQDGPREHCTNNPSAKDSDNTQKHLDRLEDVLVGEPQFHSVYCDNCDWYATTWLGREAEIRGKVHEASHENDHKTMIDPVLYVDQNLTELGLNDAK